MNLIHFLIFSTAVLCIGCAIEARSNEILDSSSNHVFQPKTIDEKKKNDIKLIDLNVDVLLLIFDELDLESVINMVEANSEFTSLGITRYQRMYGNKVKLLNGFQNDEKFLEYVSYYMPRPTPTLNMFDSELILKLFKYLAPAIQDVEFSAGKNGMNQSNTIGQYINKYGSKYITKLDLYPVDDNTFEQFTVPFEHVNELFIKMTPYLREFKLPVMAFNQLFPNVRKLYLILQSTTANYSFFDCELPQFDELKISISNDVSQATDIIERLLSKNQQIRIIISLDFSKDLIKMVHTFLPNIECLMLDSFDTENDTFHFDHVKTFRVNRASSDSIGKISFSHLESINIRCETRDINNWIDFFNRHPNVSRLTLRNDYHDIPLLQLTAGLHNLTDVVLDCDNITVKEVTQFIESHEKLRRFEYTIFFFKTEYETTLRNRFENEWNITRHRTRLLFEKKN